MESAFKAAEKLVVEVDIQKSQMALAMKAMQMAMYPAEQSLSGSLSEATKKKWTEYQAEKGIPGATMERFKPWFVAMSVMQMELGKLGYDPQQGVDMHFLKAAADRQMEVLELETGEQQLKIFADMEPKMQEEMLRYTMEEMSQMGTKIDQLFEAWKKGNESSLSALMNEAFEKDKSLDSIKKAIFTDRNLAMSEKIDGYLKGKGTYFVVVGAGHLVGEDGIVKLLEKKQYGLTRK
jgi:hypothetical protein